MIGIDQSAILSFSPRSHGTCLILTRFHGKNFTQSYGNIQSINRILMNVQESMNIVDKFMIVFLMMSSLSLSS